MSASALCQCYTATTISSKVTKAPTGNCPLYKRFSGCNESLAYGMYSLFSSSSEEIRIMRNSYVRLPRERISLVVQEPLPLSQASSQCWNFLDQNVENSSGKKGRRFTPSYFQRNLKYHPTHLLKSICACYKQIQRP